MLTSLPPSHPPTPLPPTHATQATLSAKAYMRGERFNPSDPASLGFSTQVATATASSSYR